MWVWFFAADTVVGAFGGVFGAVWGKKGFFGERRAKFRQNLTSKHEITPKGHTGDGRRLHHELQREKCCKMMYLPAPYVS